MHCLLQVQLDSMHQRATATEAKLLDQITFLQQQLDKERSARYVSAATAASSNRQPSNLVETEHMHMCMLQVCC
jgi:hypothetical protein